MRFVEGVESLAMPSDEVADSANNLSRVHLSAPSWVAPGHEQLQPPQPQASSHGQTWPRGFDRMAPAGSGGPLRHPVPAASCARFISIASWFMASPLGQFIVKSVPSEPFSGLPITQ